MLNPYLAIAPELPQGTCEVIVERYQHDGYVFIWHRVRRSYKHSNDLLPDPARGMTWSSIAEASGVSSRPLYGGALKDNLIQSQTETGMFLVMADCHICQMPRTFRHAHDTAHGIEGTHMAGSERFTCDTCGTSVYSSDNDGQFDFVLDKS